MNYFVISYKDIEVSEKVGNFTTEIPLGHV